MHTERTEAIELHFINSRFDAFNDLLNHAKQIAAQTVLTGNLTTRLENDFKFNMRRSTESEGCLVFQCCVKDLDIETLAHIDAENRRQTLEEEIEFLKSVHEQVNNFNILQH